MKKLRLIIFMVSVAYLTVMSADSVSAQGNSLSNPGIKTPFQNLKISTDSAGTLNSSALENLRNRAISEIDRRITALNGAVNRLGVFKKVSEAAKSSLTLSIQAEIARLTDLKTKIQAETDLTVLRTDAKSIVTSHRIFALFLPQVRLLTAADALKNAADKMALFASKLETRIASAQSGGDDVSSLQTLLTSMKTNMADALLQADAVINAVTPLTPDGYPANKTALMTARQNLQKGHKNLKSAAQNARSIMQGLKSMSKEDKSGTESSMMIQE